MNRLAAAETRLAIMFCKQLLHTGLRLNSATAFLPGQLLHFITRTFYSKLVKQVSVHTQYTILYHSTMFWIQTSF